MSKKDLNIDIHHVTRIEGHGNIVVNAKEGKLKEVKWEVPESPRFFEAMLVGRPYTEASHITSRVCGICSSGHTLASLKATEDAMEIKVSRQTWLLRKLLSDGEFIQSHILHVCFLTLPDLLGVESVIPLAGTHPEVVKTALYMKKLGNDIADVVGGRAVHPITPCVGGFTHVPSTEELKGLREKLVESIPKVNAIAEVAKSVAGNLPDFKRETEFISLVWDKEYPWIDGDILSSDSGRIPYRDYAKFAKEFVIKQSTAKWAKNNRSSYFVGALARFNNNYKQLSESAKKVASMFGLTPGNCNPFMNNVAQIVETVHCIEEAIAVVDELLKKGLAREDVNVKPRAGRGVGAVEVPRGILFHEYEYNDEGLITYANLVIPTNQNHANIEDDMKAWVPKMLGDDFPEAKIAHNLEMLVRAYDPCVSCSTHFLNVKFE